MLFALGYIPRISRKLLLDNKLLICNLFMYKIYLKIHMHIRVSSILTKISCRPHKLKKIMWDIDNYRHDIVICIKEHLKSFKI